MIARVSTIAAIVSALAAAALAQDANRPFDLSLSAAHLMDLSPVYQQVIREATDAYRGDFPDYGVFVVTTRIVGDRRSHFLTSTINVPPELQEDFDPFPRIPFTLRRKPEEVTSHR
jgi:hypothetical protein